MQMTMRSPLNPNRIEVVDEQIADVLRRKSPSQRLAMAFSANRTARLLILAGIKHQHPDWTTQQMTSELTRRMLGAA